MAMQSRKATCRMPAQSSSEPQEYSQNDIEWDGAPPGECQAELATELRRTIFDEDLYDSVMIAAFGGIWRHGHGKQGQVQVHPLFIFILCLPLFGLQSALIILMELDFDNTAPVIADGVRNPTALLLGKVLMAGCLQLVLFAELCQSLRLLCLCGHPGFWTDVKHFRQDGYEFLSRPLVLAPISFVAILLKTIIAFWVTLSSLSVVLVCEDVPACIMNSLAVVFISDLDQHSWSICKVVYEFDSFADFTFKVQPCKARREERRKSWFSCVLDENGSHDPWFGNIVSGIFLLCIYAWQALVVTFAIDTNILPVARDMCAGWHLLHGKEEYRISPQFFSWLVHLYPVNIKRMVTHMADPNHYGYCSEKYAVMRISDVNDSIKKHPWIAVTSFLAIIVAIGLPHLWFCISSSRTQRQGVRTEVFSRLNEVDDEISELHDRDERLARRVLRDEKIQAANAKGDAETRKLIQEVKEEGARQIATFKEDMDRLHDAFRAEGKRGEQFQNELQEFQTNVFEQFQEGVEELRKKVKHLEQSHEDVTKKLEDILSKKLQHDETGIRSARGKAVVLASHVVATSSQKCASSSLETEAEASQTIPVADDLDFEELNSTQRYAVVDVDGQKEFKAIDVTRLPTSPCPNAPDMNLTRAPESILKDANLTMSPIVGSPDDLHYTLPPVISHPRARGLDMTVSPANVVAISGGHALGTGNQHATPQMTAFMEEMKSQMTELRQFFGTQQEQKSQAASDMEAIMNEVRALKANFVPVKEATVISHRDDVLSQTKLVTLPTSQQCPSNITIVGRTVAQTYSGDDTESNATLHEAAQYLSPGKCSTDPNTSVQDFSPRVLQLQRPPEIRSASHTPPLAVQRSGQTVVLPPRARSVTAPRVARSDTQHRRYVPTPPPELPSQSSLQPTKLVAKSVPILSLSPGISNCTGADMPRAIGPLHASAPRLAFSTSDPRSGMPGADVVRQETARKEPAQFKQQVQLHYPRY